MILDGRLMYFMDYFAGYDLRTFMRGLDYDRIVGDGLARTREATEYLFENEERHAQFIIEAKDIIGGRQYRSSEFRSYIRNKFWREEEQIFQKYGVDYRYYAWMVQNFPGIDKNGLAYLAIEILLRMSHREVYGLLHDRSARAEQLLLDIKREASSVGAKRNGSPVRMQKKQKNFNNLVSSSVMVAVDGIAINLTDDSGDTALASTVLAAAAYVISSCLSGD